MTAYMPDLSIPLDGSSAVTEGRTAVPRLWGIAEPRDRHGRAAPAPV
jgi:hypothetical protein